MKTTGSGAVTEKYAGVTSAAVEKATGRGWNEWTRILDRAGARNLSHKDIAKWLRANHGDALSAWWCQMITVGYEQKRGMRAVGQKTDGFSANASKTFTHPLASVYRAFVDSRLRGRWLGQDEMRISTASKDKTIRIAWFQPDSRIVVNFYEKGENKCLVQIEHSRLPNASTRARTKRFWTERLVALHALLNKH